MVNSSQRSYFPPDVKGVCSIPYQLSFHINYYEGDCFISTVWIRFDLKMETCFYYSHGSLGVRFDLVVLLQCYQGRSWSWAGFLQVLILLGILYSKFWIPIANCCMLGKTLEVFVLRSFIPLFCGLFSFLIADKP